MFLGVYDARRWPFRASGVYRRFQSEIHFQIPKQFNRDKEEREGQEERENKFGRRRERIRNKGTKSSRQKRKKTKRKYKKMKKIEQRDDREKAEKIEKNTSKQNTFTLIFINDLKDLQSTIADSVEEKIKENYTKF